MKTDTQTGAIETVRFQGINSWAVLHLGDCGEFEPSRYDLLLTDPPYGIDAGNRERIASRANLAEAKDYGDNEWDKSTISDDLILSLREQCRWQIIFGGNYYSLPPSSCWLVWEKENTGDFADGELAWTNLQKAVRIKRHMWNGMIRKGHEERFHPTQKPVAVMAWALEMAPVDVRLVFDPMMGSGTTGIACLRTGRNFVGIERDEKHFKTACERFAREVDGQLL